jgi:hypothetical protein
MKRRTLLTLGAGMAASMLTGLKPAAADLEPDGQWLIYRRYSLLIVGQRDNEIVLVCRPDFQASHAYLVAQTLAEHKDALPTPARAPAGVVPAHRGSLAFFAGEAMPS